MTIRPARVPLVDGRGFMTREWYEYFAKLERTVGGDIIEGGSGVSITGSGAGGTTIGLADNGVTNAKLRDSLGLSVIGRPTASDGNPQDIVAAANGRVLMRSGDVVGFFPLTASSSIPDGDYGDITVSGSGSTWNIDAGVVGTTELAADAVTFAKVQNIATDRLIGRDTAASGDPEEITVGGGLEFTGTGGVQRSALTGDVTAAAGNGATTIANDAVTNAKAADMAEATVKGRAAGAGTGDPTDLTAAQVRTLLALVIGTNVQAWDADLDTLAAAGLGAAWTAYTPTVTPNAGTITTVSTAGRWLKLGKLVFFRLTITITNNGTGSGFLSTQVPHATPNVGASNIQMVFGNETAAVGFAVSGRIANNSTTMLIYKYDNTYPGGTGYTINIGGSYEAA